MIRIRCVKRSAADGNVSRAVPRENLANTQLPGKGIARPLPATHRLIPVALPEVTAPPVIEFIDVGQGDAVLTLLPNEGHWAIDAGLARRH